MKRFLISNLFCFFLTLVMFSQSIPNSFSLKLIANLDASVGDFGQLKFSPTGKYFLAVDYNKTALIWETAAQKRKFALSGKITSVNFSPNEKWLAVFYKKEARILETATGNSKAVFGNYKNEIYFLGWSPNSQTLVIGTNDFGVELWDAESGKLENSFIIHEKKSGFFKRFFDDAQPFLMTAAFSPDGKRLLTNCKDSIAELWDLETGKLLLTFSNRLEDVGNMTDGSKFVPASIRSARFSSDGKWIATTSNNETRIWNAETDVLIESFSGFTFPQFSPNGLYFGILDDPISNTATKIYDLRARNTKLLLPKYSGIIVAWSPDSRMFITDRTLDEVSKDKAIIWNLQTGEQKGVIETYSKGCFDLVSTCRSDWDAFLFSPNSQILMARNHKEVKFFNPENGALIYKSEEAKAPSSWSPDGKIVLANSKEKGKILLWEVSGK